MYITNEGKPLQKYGKVVTISNKHLAAHPSKMPGTYDFHGLTMSQIILWFDYYNKNYREV